MPISPAPWILDGLSEDEDGKFYRVISQGKLVAKVYDGEEGHANARLVTASPELRNELTRLTHAVSRYWGEPLGGPSHPKYFDDFIYPARHAIDRASEV